MENFIKDEEFGVVKVLRRRGMLRVIMRVRQGQLIVTAPLQCTLGDVLGIINRDRDKLRDLWKHAEKVDADRLIGICEVQCFGFKACVARDDGGVDDNPVDFMVRVPEKADFADPNVQRAIVRVIRCELMWRWHLIHDYAVKVIAELGVSGVSSIEMGRGIKQLGSCSRSGVIRLSYALLLMPESLIRYVVCHELAHLKHMNHSAEFHKLCNSYLQGREQELEAQMRQFRWPFPLNL